MTKEIDAIDAILRVLKRVAKRRNHTPDWAQIERDLRAFVAEFTLANSIRIRTLKGVEYRQRGAVTARVAQSRGLLQRAKASLAAARSLPALLSEFAETTYGDAGLTLIPSQAAKNYAAALDELDACLLAYEEILKQTVARAGITRGAKVPLLHMMIGTPTVRFLQRLIPLWREASGQKSLGERFQDVAKQLMEIALPSDSEGRPAEIADLKRQIENAVRRGPIVRSEGGVITDLMNEQPTRSRRKP